MAVLFDTRANGSGVIVEYNEPLLEIQTDVTLLSVIEYEEVEQLINSIQPMKCVLHVPHLNKEQVEALCLLVPAKLVLIADPKLEAIMSHRPFTYFIGAMHTLRDYLLAIQFLNTHATPPVITFEDVFQGLNPDFSDPMAVESPTVENPYHKNGFDGTDTDFY